MLHLPSGSCLAVFGTSISSLRWEFFTLQLSYFRLTSTRHGYSDDSRTSIFTMVKKISLSIQLRVKNLVGALCSTVPFCIPGLSKGFGACYIGGLCLHCVEIYCS